MGFVQRRLVTVTAVVLTEKTEGPEDIAASFEVVAGKLAELARRRRAGWTGHLLPLMMPATRFEARSEPVPDEQAADLSTTDLREMLDRATRVMANLGRPAEVYEARDIRAQAGLEAL
jgi:hypothetical protein